MARLLRRGAVLSVLATAVFLAVSLYAQQTTFRSGIELVQIDVVVVDRQGRHVRGLKAADFALTDRKKSQTIAAFEEVTHERPHAVAGAREIPPARMDVADNQSVQAHRLVVMVIDDLHIYRGRTDVSKQIARDVLTQLGADASMAVLFTSGEHSTEVTEDRAALLNAVETLKGRKAIRRPHPAVDQQRASGSADIGRANTASLQDFFDNMSKYKALEDAARLLGQGDARRKAFVVISEGIAKDLTGVFDAATTPCDAKCPRCPCYHEHAARMMMNSLRRSNVVAYGIDPRGAVPAHEIARELFGVTLAGEGLGENVDDSIFRWSNPVRQAQDGLTILAEASGGFAVVNTDNFTAGIDRILDDLDHYYLLGFYPSDPKGDGYRPVDVTVPNHPELRVRFRKGYRAEGPPKPPKNSSPRAAMMAGTLPVTALPMRLHAVPLAPVRGGNARVAVAMEIEAPAGALQEPDGRLRDDITYEIVAVDQNKGKVRSLGGEEARVTLSPSVAGRPLPETAAYQIAQTIELDPGRYQLRVAAESRKLARGGSVYLHVTVPDFGREPLTLSGLAIGYANGARVATTTVEPARRRAPARRGFVAPPPPPPALPFAPTLDREFSTEDVLRVYAEVMRKDQRAPLAGELALVGTDGKATRSFPIAPDARGRIALEIPLSDLPAGSHVLRLRVTSGAHTATQEIAIALRNWSR